MFTNCKNAFRASPKLIPGDVGDYEVSAMLCGIRNYKKQMLGIEVRRYGHEKGIAEIHVWTILLGHAQQILGLVERAVRFLDHFNFFRRPSGISQNDIRINRN